MDIESIKSIWESWKEVQEKKLDPVGKEDGDIDNDGDEDSSDKYLASRRKKVSGEIAKGVGKEPANEPGENPPKVSKEKQVKVAYEEKGVNPFTKDDDDEDDSEDDEKKSKKPKKGVNPFAKKKVEDDEEEDDESVDEATSTRNDGLTPKQVEAKKKRREKNKQYQKRGLAMAHNAKDKKKYEAELKKAKRAKLGTLPNGNIKFGEGAEQPEWLQVIGEKLRAMEESDDPVADEKEAYKDDKKETGKRKAVDKEIQKGTGKEPANEPGENPPKMSKEKEVKLAYEEVEDDFDNEGDEEDAARIKKRAMRNSDVDDNGEPTKEKMKGMRSEDFASEADWRVTSMREALAVMDKQRSGLNQTAQAKNQSKMATSTEPMLDVLTSVGEAEFVLKQKQSNPDYEDLEDNKAALPTGVKTQSPSRRGTDNLNNGDGKAPRSPRK